MNIPPPLSMSYVPGMVLCPGEASGQDRHGLFLHRPHNSMGGRGRDWESGDWGKQLGNDRSEDYDAGECLLWGDQKHFPGGKAANF